MAEIGRTPSLGSVVDAGEGCCLLSTYPEVITTVVSGKCNLMSRALFALRRGKAAFNAVATDMRRDRLWYV